MATKQISRHGRCLNEKCSVCKNNEILEIPPRKEFMCPECGMPLKECAAGKQKSKLPIIIVGGIIAIGAVVGIIAISGNDKNDQGGMDSGKENFAAVDPIKNVGVEEKEALTDTLVSDAKKNGSSNVETDNAKSDKKVASPSEVKSEQIRAQASSASQSAASQSYGEHSLGYATWKGKLKNGQPHGNGTMTYTTSRLIEERDPKKRMASPGEYIIGEWDNGHLVQGRWYKSDNNKEQINIGRTG